MPGVGLIAFDAIFAIRSKVWIVIVATHNTQHTTHKRPTPDTQPVFNDVRDSGKYKVYYANKF